MSTKERWRLISGLGGDILQHGTKLGIPNSEERSLVVKTSLPCIAHGKNSRLQTDIIGSGDANHGQANPNRLGVAIAAPHDISKTSGRFVKRDGIRVITSGQRVPARCKHASRRRRDGIRVCVVDSHGPDSTGTGNRRSQAAKQKKSGEKDGGASEESTHAEGLSATRLAGKTGEKIKIQLRVIFRHLRWPREE